MRFSNFWRLNPELNHMCMTVYIFKCSRLCEMIISFIPITAACGRPFFVLQTLPDYGFVVGAKHNLRKNNQKWDENTLEALRNESAPQLEGIKRNVDVLHLYVPHELSGHFQTTSTSQADGAAFILGNYVCWVNSAFLCLINPKPLK